MDVAPLGEPQVRYETGAALVDEAPVRKLLCEPRAEEFPQREERQEVRAFVAKHEMRFVRRLLFRERPVARIGNRHRRCDHQHLGEATGVARGEHHAADARVDRQARELPAERGQRALDVDRGELLELLVAVGDRARRRRLDEWERVDLRQAERGHPQDHRGERRAQDLGFGIGQTSREIVLGIEAHADPGGDAAAAARALVRGRLRNLLDLQERRLVAQRVALDASQSRVDHVADARAP